MTRHLSSPSVDPRGAFDKAAYLTAGIGIGIGAGFKSAGFESAGLKGGGLRDALRRGARCSSKTGSRKSPPAPTPGSKVRRSNPNSNSGPNPSSNQKPEPGEGSELDDDSDDSDVTLSDPLHGEAGRGRRMLPAVPPSGRLVASSPDAMRVYATSDLHTDFRENLEWVRSLSPDLYRHDSLIVAGDVADSLKTFEETLALLKARFKHVFFVPGNHDLWCRQVDEPSDSLAKLDALLACCQRLGVETAPRKVQGVWIVSPPPEPTTSVCQLSTPPQQCCHRCFNHEGDSLARFFDAMNDAAVDADLIRADADCQVISFSHFLPRIELCPEKRMLFYPNLPKVVGSNWLEARVRALHGPLGSPSACHVFGHTHFSWDAVLDGIRYIQAPLAYPKERKRRVNGGEDWLPLLLYDSSKGGLIAGPLDCHWSSYYRSNPRDPSKTTFAPWVAKVYKPLVPSGSGTG
eukprot:jgi/Mesen1/3690/ME000202S02780